MIHIRYILVWSVCLLLACQNAGSYKKLNSGAAIEDGSSSENEESQSFGTAKVKTLKDITFQISEVPAFIRAKRLIENEQSPEFKNELTEQKKLLVYNLRIQPTDGSSIWDYEITGNPNKTWKLNYFSFHFKERIKIQTRSTLTSCILYNLIQTQNLTNHLDILIGFEAEKIPEFNDVIIVIEDDYFDFGKIKLKPTVLSNQI